MAKKTYVGVIIADIHMGAMKADDLANELDEIFIKYLESLKILDFVVIAGDLFDTKISLNSSHTKQLFIFMKKLIDVCIKHKAKLRVIKGTEFHDNNQLDILRFLTKTECDFEIYDTVGEEELFPDFNVLYIPEEYMNDCNAYYKEYFKKKYDMIFGHGMVNEVAFTSKLQDSEVTMMKAPVFSTTKLLRACKGPMFFGHIHKSQCIKKRLYYVGSFSRWAFGEEEPKGFMSVVYSPENHKYEVEFIENTLAREYKTIVIGEGSDFFEKDEEEQIKYALSLSQETTSGKLRLVFNIPEDYGNTLLLTNLIGDVFAKYKHVKIMINNNSKEKRRKQETDEKIKILLSTYDFIFDDGIPPEEKLSRFIKIKYNRDIGVDDMRDYLYQKITKDNI